MYLIIASILTPFVGWVIFFMAMAYGGHGNKPLSRWSREDLKDNSFKAMLFGLAIAGLGLGMMLGLIIAIIFGWRPES